MTIGLIALGICVLSGALCWLYNDDWTAGAAGLFVSAALVLVVWGLIHFPGSAYWSDSCDRKAEGYGLEDHDWSIRFGCRVYLPGGQLVPEDRIRITTDGQIIVSDDGGDS